MPTAPISPEISHMIQVEIGRAFARNLGAKIYDCENDAQRQGFRAQSAESSEAWRVYSESL